MRIASFCFHTGKDQVGGAQVPAIAFKRWAEIFGIECDLVTNSHNISEDIPCETKIINCESELNEYDAAFFSTPDKFGGSNFDYSKIKIKKAIMTHAEFDWELYGGEKFFENMNGADIQVVIGLDYWNFKNEFLWYPCCLPEYLLLDNYSFLDDNRRGILYSARLSRWKNAHILAMLSKIPDFYELNSPIVSYGKPNAEEYGRMIDGIKPNWATSSEIYNSYDVEKMSERNSQFEYIWDASGNANYKFKLKRFNLSCVEAFKFGCLPIAFSDSVPCELKYSIIDAYDLITTPNLLSEINFEEKRNNFINDIFESDIYNYKSVKKQIGKILEALL